MKDPTKLSIKYPLLWCMCIIVLLSSCLKGTEYPLEPEIEFISMSFADSTAPMLGGPMYIGVITIGFTDGDGDIGGFQNDTTINMFVSQINIVNGEHLSPIDKSYTIPYVTPEGQNKSLKGEIDIELFFLPFEIADTAMFEVYIEDRSKNKSNIISTPVVVISDL